MHIASQIHIDLPLTPGTYLRKRRERAGLDMEELAALLCSGTPRNDEVLNLIRAVEADATVFESTTARLIAGVIPFDAQIFNTLVANTFGADLPVPQICRECACSFHDACENDEGPCAWSDRDPNLCTHCDEGDN